MQAHRIPPRSLLVLLLLLIPNLAHADGMFVWRNRGVDILEPEQKALIIQDGGWEDLVLEVKYSGAVRDFGWIVPVPSNPALHPDNERLFETLSRVTQNEDPAHAPNLPTAGTERVDVIQQSRVGIYDTATLSSSSGEALAAWLETHRYQLEPRARSILDEYAAKGWLFVAARIAVPDSAGMEAELQGGTIQPLRFRFACSEPIFPLRVSAALGHKSEVLLYVISRHALAPSSAREVIWHSGYSKAVDRRLWDTVDPEVKFSGLRGGPALMTKMRADIAPEQMRDVTFRAIRAGDRLASPDTLERARAASILGAERDSSSVPALIRFVQTPQRTRTELRAGIWALGQIGTDDAMQEVARWVGDGRGAFSRDAIITLESAGSRRGIESCLAIVARGPTDEMSAWSYGDPVRDTPLHYLVRVLRRPDLSLVDTKLPRTNAPLRMGREPFQRVGLGPGDVIRLVLGDRKTMEWVCDSLVAGGQATGAPYDPYDRRNGSMVNGFPMAYWTGAAVAIGVSEASWSWPLLSSVLEKLQDFPDRRDEVLRRLADDTQLPQEGRVIAIACLKAPTSAEWEYLRRAWKSARGGEDTRVTVQARFLGGYEGDVDYARRACQIAYAFGRLRGVGDLLPMWAEVRNAGVDDVLRGDVAYGLALTDSTPAVEPLVEYVRTTWARKFVEPRLVNFGRVKRPPMAEIHYAPGADFEYRTSRIQGLLAMRASSEQLATLIRDRSLPTYFRLFWIANAYLWRKEVSQLVPIAYENIHQIEEGAGSDSLLVGACHEARRSVDVAVKIRDGKVKF